MKIREKLLVSVLAAVTIVLIAASWLSYASSKRALVKEIKLHAESTLKAYAWELDSNIAALPIVAHAMAVAVSSLYPESTVQIKDLIRISLGINPYAYGSTIAFAPGVIPGGPKLVSPYYFRTKEGLGYKDLAAPSYDYTKWNWFKIPMETGKPHWSEPYIDVGGGEIAMVTYSYPIVRQDKLLGVTTVDIDLEDLTEDIERIVVGQTGRAFLLSKNGTFLTIGEEKVALDQTIFDYAKEKPNREKVIELGKEMTAGGSGFVSMDDPVRSEKAWIVYGPIPTTSWSLGIIFPEAEFLGELTTLYHNMIIISAAGLAVLFGLIFVISARISKPIGALADHAKRIADGDLSTEAVGSESRDEVGVLARAFGEMQGSLVETLAKLREEKDMFTAAFSQMSDGLVILSPHWEALQANRAAERFLMLPAQGHFRDHILARFDSSVPAGKMTEVVDKPIRFELKRRESEQLGPLVLETMVAPIARDNGELREFIMSVRDVTEERAEETSKANFLSLISHKLRTPVTLLKSGVSLLQDGLLGEMNDKQNRQIGSMGNQAAKLQSLIEVLIGYSAIEGKPLETAKEEIDIGEFWKTISKGALETYSEKNPKIDLEIEPGVEKIEFNKQYLAMVFSQLLDNALKFNMSEPAEIKVRVHIEGGEIVTEVRDNGVGIPPEYLDRIFEKFFQIEKYFTGNVEGMGLGLSYVKSIVEHFGGSIEVSSKAGEGSVFTVKLPAS